MTTETKGLLDNQPPRPNPCTYWVTESLMAGEHPTDRAGLEASRHKIRQYLDCGIDFFVDLTRPGEKMDYQEILLEQAQAPRKGVHNSRSCSNTIGYVRFAIPDFGVPSPELMKKILDTIDEAIEKEKRKVYVHCRGGIGRTGTTVGCYLARHGSNAPLEEVNRLFQSSNRSMESSSSPETREQMDFVRNWAKGS